MLRVGPSAEPVRSDPNPVLTQTLAAHSCYGNFNAGPPQFTPVWSAYNWEGKLWVDAQAPAPSQWVPKTVPAAERANVPILVKTSFHPSPPPKAKSPPPPPSPVFAPGKCAVTLSVTTVNSEDSPTGTQKYLQVVNAIPVQTPVRARVRPARESRLNLAPHADAPCRSAQGGYADPTAQARARRRPGRRCLS